MEKLKDFGMLAAFKINSQKIKILLTKKERSKWKTKYNRQKKLVLRLEKKGGKDLIIRNAKM